MGNDAANEESAETIIPPNSSTFKGHDVHVNSVFCRSDIPVIA